MKRLEKGSEERMRQLSEVREKMNNGGESISRYLVDLEKKVRMSLQPSPPSTIKYIAQIVYVSAVLYRE